MIHLQQSYLMCHYFNFIAQFFIHYKFYFFYANVPSLPFKSGLDDMQGFIVLMKINGMAINWWQDNNGGVTFDLSTVNWDHVSEKKNSFGHHWLW